MISKKLVAIGGGEIGGVVKGKQMPLETEVIDREIIKISGKLSPKVLFVSTASWDAQNYIDSFRRYYEGTLDCIVADLKLRTENLSYKEISKKVFDSDIIYVGGGDTIEMLERWKEVGFDEILDDAYKKGIILSGQSAGSNCWFKFGMSDSLRVKDSKEDFIKVKGLDFIEAGHCPHYHDDYADRVRSMKKVMKERDVCIALDTCVAIEIVEGKYRIITSKEGAHGYKVYIKDEAFVEEIIEEVEEYRDYEELLVL